MNILGYNIERAKKKKILDSIIGDNIYDKELYNSDFLEALKSLERNSSVSKLVSELRSDVVKRNNRYKEYKKVAKDPVIGQAIEMMADDATQFDVERERTVWVESPDKEYADAINGIIEDYIEPFIDTIASGIISKGEFAFKVNKDETGEKRGNFKDIVLVPYKNIERLHHLILPNQDRVYFESDDIGDFSNKDKYVQFKGFDSFLHFINYSLDNSEEVQLKFEKSASGKYAGKKVDVFVLQGESIITEKVLESYKILRSLENALISYRLAKSKIVRFVTVEVAKLASPDNVQAIINYVHSSIVSNESISSTDFEESGIQSEPVVVTLPIKQGTGAINIEEFASEANISEIADLDYFMNKIFAGLRTPRSYFNFDESLPGGGMSGTSLTRMDVRYARAVKKVQRVIVNTIKDLIWIFNEANGLLDSAPEVHVKIVKVASSEDYDRYQEYEQRLQVASQVINGLIDMNTGQVNMAAVDMQIKFFTHVVPSTDMVNFLNSLKKKVDIKSKPAGVVLKGVMK